MFFVVITNQSIFVQSQEWNNLNPFGQPPGNYLYGLDFIDNQRGWAVGEWGIYEDNKRWTILASLTKPYD